MGAFPSPVAGVHWKKPQSLYRLNHGQIGGMNHFHRNQNLGDGEMDIFKALELQEKYPLQLRHASLPLDLRKNTCGGNQVKTDP